MPPREIAKLGNPALRAGAEAVEVKEIRSEPFQRLIDDMVETMRAENGIGLAAPQVSVPKRLVVAEYPGEGPELFGLLVCVNPRFVSLSDEKVEGWEGCLSVDNLRGRVERHRAVEMEYLDRAGAKRRLKTDRFLAVVLQHECDHLDGMLFLDRMKDLSTLSQLEEFGKYWVRGEEVAVA